MMSKVKSTVSIKRELKRIENFLKRKSLDPVARAEAYGAQQALAWMLDSQSAMSPFKAVTMSDTAMKKSPHR